VLLLGSSPFSLSIKANWTHQMSHYCQNFGNGENGEDLDPACIYVLLGSGIFSIDGKGSYMCDFNYDVQHTVAVCY